VGVVKSTVVVMNSEIRVAWGLKGRLTVAPHISPKEGEIWGPSFSNFRVPLAVGGKAASGATDVLQNGQSLLNRG
jgi:hypothetical protein